MLIYTDVEYDSKNGKLQGSSRLLHGKYQRKSFHQQVLHITQICRSVTGTYAIFMYIVCPSKLEGLWGQHNIFLKKLQGSLANIC